MSVYLKQFSTHAEYDAYINGSDAILPNVSICTTEGDVHYNPYMPPPPSIVVVKCNVTDTSNPTRIAKTITGFSVMEIDGVEQPSVVNEYTFSTTGIHTVKYTLKEKNIGNSTFQQCYSLTSVTIPDGVTSIGNSAFTKCYSITNITIPDGVTSIGGNAFYQCRGLTSCTIGSGVTSIGYGAFCECRSLTSITIGSGVTTIGDFAFDGCSGLTSITVEATTPPTLSSYVFRNTNNCPIYVPSASVSAYKAATNWSTYASRIQTKP